MNGDYKHIWLIMISIWLWINTYKMFEGMNIHQSKEMMCFSETVGEVFT